MFKPQSAPCWVCKIGHLIEIPPLDVTVKESSIATAGSWAVQMRCAHSGAAGSRNVVVATAVHGIQKNGWVGDHLGGGNATSRSGGGRFHDVSETGKHGIGARVRKHPDITGNNIGVRRSPALRESLPGIRRRACRPPPSAPHPCNWPG